MVQRGKRHVLACAVVVVLAASGASGAGDRQRVTMPLAPGQIVEIRTTVGEVVVTGEDRADVFIDVEREVPRDTIPDVLPIRIEPTDGTLVVSVEQPQASAPNPSMRARIVVALPRSAPLRVAVAEGSFRVEGSRGPIEAKVEHGTITARDVAGIVRLETGTGALTVEGARLPKDGLLRLRTLDGDITVALSEAPKDARVILMSLQGAIESALPLEERQGFGRRFREGVFGTGQPLLSADSVRGAIRLTVP